MSLRRLLSGHNPEPETRTVYVPVVLTDTRAHAEKWDDPVYLATVKGFASNEVFLGEVLAELTAVRDAADRATTPDVLAGCKVGIDALKRLLAVGVRAGATLSTLRRLEGMDGSAE
jgi:hypothetical protein